MHRLLTKLCLRATRCVVTIARAPELARKPCSTVTLPWKGRVGVPAPARSRASSRAMRTPGWGEPRASPLRLTPPRPPLGRATLPLQGRVAARGTFSNPTVTGKLASTLLMVPALVLLLGGTALAADAPPGASACSGCHPAGSGVDTPVKRLKGQAVAQIVAAVQEFRSGTRPATVMDRIAKGFTDDEIRAIAAWYAAQKD